MYHYLSIGSNIDPEINIARCIEQLLTRFDIAHLYPCTYTAPEQIDSERVFLNTLLIIKSDLDPAELKRQFCAIEESLGRDRSDKDRSRKDRTCDIDLVFSDENCHPEFFRRCNETYLRKVLSRNSMKAEVTIFGSKFSDRPASVYFESAAGDKAVIEYKADPL